MLLRLLLVLAGLIAGVSPSLSAGSGYAEWMTPREQVIFDGRPNDRWEKYSAAGGNFDKFARYDNGVLVVDVPKDSGWGKTGIFSKAPVLWLDEFGEGASAAISIEIDPDRTTLAAIALTPGQTSDDTWSLESALVYWRLKPDGSGAVLDLYDHSRITAGEKHLELPKTAPGKLRLVLIPGKIIAEIDGKPAVDLPFPMARPGVGFLAYIHTGALDANFPGKMALRSVKIERTPAAEAMSQPQPAEGVAPLPVRRVFPGPAKGWEPFGLDGGDFAKFGKAGADGVLISAPEKAGWARTGIVSATQLFGMDAMSAEAPHRLALAFDAAKTTGAMVFISPAKSGWFYREVAASVAIHRIAPDRWRLAAYSGDQLMQSRDFKGSWDGRLTLDMGGHRAVLGVLDGPQLVIFNPYFEPPHQMYVSVLTRPLEADKAATLLLKSIDLTRLPPPGMTAAARWRLLDDKEFDPGAFLKELLDLPEEHGALPFTPRTIVTDARGFIAPVGARLAQAEAQSSSDRPVSDALSRQVAERLHNLNREKLDALLNHIGVKAPDGFYGCLCSGRWHAAHVAVSYNGKSGACHFSGFGEWEEPLPNAADAWSWCAAENRFPDGRSIVDVIAGAVKDLRKKQPVVADKPQNSAPPPILVDPKACGREDAHRAERIRAYTQLEMNHFPAAGLKALDVSLRKRITDLDQPGALPTWWESVGLAAPPAADKADKERWCTAMLDRYDAMILPLLQRGNPVEIATALRKYSAALGQFDKAAQEQSEAAIEIIAADQKEVEAIVSMVPLAGQALDLIAVANWLTGDKELGLTGEAITTTDIFIRSLGYIAPAALAEAMSRSPTMHLIAAGLSEMGAAYGATGKAALVKLLGGPESALMSKLATLAEIMTKERAILVNNSRTSAGNAIARFGSTPAGLAERELLETEGRNARALLDRMKGLEPGTPEWELAVREVRANKTAMRVANSSEYDDALRRRINQTTDGWYHNADAATAADLHRLLTADAREAAAIAHDLGIDAKAAERFRVEARALAEKQGVDVSELAIRAKTVTNRRPGQTAEKLGFDRDGTFEAVAPSGVAQDIDHNVSGNPYYNRFATAAGATPAEIAAAGGPVRWSSGRMDQTITSKGALDAYNHGNVQLKDFLDKSITPTIEKVEDVRDTITHKSIEWFEKNPATGLSAAEINQNTVEGLRQATKQWDDIILSRAKAYGVDVENVVPERLSVAMTLFNRAKDGRLSARQVEEGLAALSTTVGGTTTRYTKEAAIADMGAFFEMLEKGPGKVYRDVEGKKVAGMVQVLAASKQTGWQNGALTTLNDALREGKISGEHFMKLRADVMAEAVKGMPPADFANWLKSAYTQGLVNATEVAAGAR